MKSKKPTLEDQLAFISAQHDVYPTELFAALALSKNEVKDSWRFNSRIPRQRKYQSIFLITKRAK